MGHSKLTAKQESFAQDIANKKYKFHWEAYAANYNSQTNSKNSLYVKSCELLANSKVAVRIAEIEAKIKAKEKLTLDEILVRLAKRNEIDIRGLLNDDGTFKKISELTEDQAIFITGFKVTEIWGKGDDAGTQLGRTVDVKIESFKDIMDMLIRNHGGYAKDKESATDNLELLRDIVEGIKK